MFTRKEQTVIYQAFDMYCADICKNLPSNDELSHITFTKEFEQKMQKLIKNERKFYFYWVNTVGKRVAIIVLAIIFSLTTLTFSVKSLRDSVIRFFVKEHKTYSNLFFIDSDKGNLSDDFVFEYLSPQYVPEGFSVAETTAYTNAYMLVYYTEDKSSNIVYTQGVNDAAIMQINTEYSSEYEEFDINGNQAVYFNNTKRNTNSVITGGDNYIFIAEGTASKEELIKMLESIEIK